MKISSPFFVSKKTKNNKSVWYAHFPDPDNSQKRKVKSVETLRTLLGSMDTSPIKRKTEAIRITQQALDAGIIQFEKKNDPLVVDYIKEYWDFDTSDVIRRKNLKKANTISKGYAKNIRGTFIQNALPLFPNNLRISKLKTSHLEKIINTLIDEGSLSLGTIARVKQAMAVPLKEAYRIGLINDNPMLKVESVPVDRKEKGILTETELNKLMEMMKAGAKQGCFNRGVYLACALSTLTGMRQGEIRALHTENIKILDETNAIITIKESYGAYEQYKIPKGKRERLVPAPSWLCEELVDHAEKSPYETSIVFWSKESSSSPISSSYIRKELYLCLWDLFEEIAHCPKEMVQDGDKVDKKGNPIMIRKGEVIRRQRGVDFHSFRHYFVTWMRSCGLLTDGQLRGVVGHQDSSTTDGYTHQTESNLKRIGTITNNILHFKGEKDVS
jgi:integrase